MGMKWFLVAALTYRLRTLDIEIHDYRMLAASDYHGLAWHILAGIDFLMGDVRGNINEISSIGLLAEF